MIYKYISIDEYKSFNYNFIKLKVITSIFLILFLLFIIIFLSILKFNLIYRNKYIVIKDIDNTFLSTTVLNNDLEKIVNNNYIYLNNKKYKYEVIKINNIVNNELLVEYKTIYIKINDSFIENDILNGNIIYNKKTIIEIIYNVIFK